MKDVTIFYSPYFIHPPPLKALFGLNPFVPLAERNLSLHCVFLTGFDHKSHDCISCCTYSWYALSTVFCIWDHILCLFILHIVNSWIVIEIMMIMLTQIHVLSTKAGEVKCTVWK